MWSGWVYYANYNKEINVIADQSHILGYPLSYTTKLNLLQDETEEFDDPSEKFKSILSDIPSQISKY